MTAPKTGRISRIDDNYYYTRTNEILSRKHDEMNLRKKLAEGGGPYGPSTETSRRSTTGEGDESTSYSFFVQLPSHLIMTLIVSASKLLLEITVKGCHCSLDMVGIFKNMVLVGV